MPVLCVLCLHHRLHHCHPLSSTWPVPSPARVSLKSLASRLSLVRQCSHPAVALSLLLTHPKPTHIHTGITIAYKLTNLVLNSIDFGDVTIATSPTGGIQLSTSGLTIVASMVHASTTNLLAERTAYSPHLAPKNVQNWAYVDEHTIIHGSGTAVDTMVLNMEASFFITADAAGDPQLGDVSVDLTMTKLDIKTEPKAVEILIALLKGPLKHGFQTMMQEELLTTLSTTLNKVTKTSGTLIVHHNTHTSCTCAAGSVGRAHDLPSGQGHDHRCWLHVQPRVHLEWHRVPH